METSSKSQSWRIVIISLIALTSASVFVAFFAYFRLAPPPIELISTDYEERSSCPGDTLVYTATWYINRPVSLAIITPVRSVVHGNTVSLDPEPTYTSVYKPQKFIDRANKIVVPELPPGQYERLLTVWAANETASPAIIVQRFRIRDDCSN